jgi:hypothetical protein
MASSPNMMIDHLRDPVGLTFSIQSVEVIHDPAEDSGIGHLTTDDSGLNFGTPYEAPKLVCQKNLNLPDQLGPLIIEDIHLLKCLHEAVLSISA